MEYDFSDNQALADEFGKTYTYGQLNSKVEWYKQNMDSRRVILMSCDSDIETVSLYYCMMKLKIVPILFNPKDSAEKIFMLCEKYHPGYLWISQKLRMDNAIAGIVKRQILEEKYILAETLYTKYELHPQLALLLSTSGSTGSTKMVRTSYENLDHGIRRFSEAIKLTEQDRLITALPLFYCFGGNLLFCAWSVGACVYITRRSALEPEFSNLLRRERITAFFAVPYTLTLLLSNGFFQTDYPNLRAVVVAGAKLEMPMVDHMRLLADNGNLVRFYYGYGQTEGTTCLTLMDAGELYLKKDSIGKVIRGTEAYIRKSASNKDGELVFQGKAVTMGYSENYHDLKRNDDNNGTLYSGDMAVIDEDGYIFLKGRDKRIIKILGMRVGLDEVETILTEKFPQAVFACVGADDALAVYYESGEDIEREIENCMLQSVSVPRKKFFSQRMTRLPRMESGKVDYPCLDILFKGEG